MRAVSLLVPLALALGCDDDTQEEELFGDRFQNGRDDDRVPLEVPEPLDCVGLAGTFTADALELVAADPPVVEDFGGAPDLTTRFDPAAGTFASTLTRGAEVLTAEGTFTVVRDRLVLSGPLVPGMGDAPAAFDCALDEGTLALAGATTFDFGDPSGGQPIPADFAGIWSTNRP